MRVHEYQAKELMRQFGIPTPAGGVASTAVAAREIAGQFRGGALVKAQAHTGGRGKAGGIKYASSMDEAESAAASLLGRRLVTTQTGPAGVPVSRVLVEESIGVECEFYLGIAIDSTERLPVVMASEAGGMDIEEVARKSPERIVKAHVDPITGFQPFQGRKIAYGLRLAPSHVKAITGIAGNLFRLFQERDCSLAEINPLALTADKKLIALDAKLDFDDNALFRHPEIASLRDPEQEDALEVKAASLGIRNYVKLDGNIGCMVNGAGLALAVLDMVHQAGGRPADFLDIGTANNTERVVNAFRLFVSDVNVKVILICIFGGIARVDIIAEGIVEAFRTMNVSVPVVLRLAGNNVQEGEQILKEAGINVIRADSMQEAAEIAVRIQGGGIL